MQCTRPVESWWTNDGTLSFERPPSRATGDLQLRCQRCINCKLYRAGMWALRCVHEAQMHEHSVFITLTFNDEHVPFRGMLDYRPFQKFMKRLRKRFAMFDVTLWQQVPRFYMCGEYGELLGRPHYHACLFGVDFPDKTYWRTNENGDRLYRSAMLEKLWPYGHAELGAVTVQSAGYVARYVLKKITGDQALEHYEKIDPITLERYSLPPEFNRMSLKPGIGATWFQQFTSDVFHSEKAYVVHEGRKHSVPRYYHQLLERKNPALARKVTRDKQAFAAARGAPSRRALAAEEAVSKGRVQSLQRKLK